MKEKNAFTFAEILIAIVVIGVVAVLIIPLMQNLYRKAVLGHQFKKSYSQMDNAWEKMIADFGETQPQCYYDKDGNSANNNFTDCDEMLIRLRKVLNVSRVCLDEAFTNKCIPNYDGIDTVYKNLHKTATNAQVNVAIAGCEGYTKSSIIHNRQAWVLSDGQIIIWYSGPQIFLLDVNGLSRPNKWGYDLFAFYTSGSKDSQYKIVSGGCEATDEGGISTAEMINQFYTKNIKD